jgi:transposase
MAPTKDTKDDRLSRKRAELIIKVRSGQMTATEAAAALCVSRKTYYEWEERALQGMLSALENGMPGRPRREVDQEKEALKDQVKKLEKDLAVHQTALKVRDLLGPVFPPPTEERTEGSRPVKCKTASKKNKRRKR